MTEKQAPTSVPMQSATTTSTTSARDQECRECGWPFGPDLTRVWVLGRLTTICRNPWACYGRVLDEREHLEQISRPTSSR